MAIIKVKDNNGNIIAIPALKGDKGDKGESFKYSDFTEEQLTALKPTATDTYSATSSEAMSGKAVASAISGISIPDAITESTVSGWGFTKNTGTLTSDSTLDATKLSGTIPASCYTVPVTSVNGQTGTVSISVPTVTDTYSATSTNAMSGKAVASAISGITHPVSSVNGKTGAVTISTDDGDVDIALVNGLFDNDEPAGVENPSEYYTKDAADTKFATKSSVPTVTDTYSATSSDAMSGIAVKSAIDSALGDIGAVLTQLGV